MILSFTTQWRDGNPTYFPEKIWIGILSVKKFNNADFVDYVNLVMKRGYHFDLRTVGLSKQKIHTIREDKHNRWKPGMLIHFTIFCRRPNMVQFAPVDQCVSTQSIEIDYNDGLPIVVIEGHHFYNPKLNIDRGMEVLAKNDGFNSISDFFRVFNYQFRGKIIHWTELKY